MDNTEAMRKGIAALEKQISLRQIGLQSNINYITLRKIKSGETKNVSSGVLARFEAFKKQFDPSKAAFAKKKPGPKPKAKTAAPAATAKKKPGPKPKAKAAVAATAKKKPGPKPKAAAAAPATIAKKKPGPKPKVAAAAPATIARKKPGPKPKAAVASAKKKPGRPKKAVASESVARKSSNFGSPLLGEALTREIEIAEARIEYLQSLQMVEEEFLRAIGKK
jgi:hypothetical protein